MAYAPMDNQSGAFEGVPMGQVFEPGHDDYHGQYQDNFNQQYGNNQEQFVAYEEGNGGKQKKNKKAKGQSQSHYQKFRDQPCIETTFEGYMCHKADPRMGQKKSWDLISKHEMHAEQKYLREIIIQHRRRTNQSSDKDYEQLPPEFKKITDRLLKEAEEDERDRNAEWTVADVERIPKRGWGKQEVKQFRVILKRRDRNYQIKRRDSKLDRDAKTAEYGEVVDLTRPRSLKKNSKGSKRLRQTRSADNVEQYDDRHGGGFQDFQHQHQQQFQPQQFQQHNDFQHQQPMPDQYPGPMNGAPQQMPPPPPGPMQMPMQFEQDNFQQGQHPPLSRHHSMVEPHFNNPFDPYPQFAVPEAMESSDMNEHLPYAPTAPKPRTRSRSMKRRDSARRPSMNARRHTQVDELNSRIRDWHVSSGSSDEDYREDSIFSRSRPKDRANDRDFSPPSSPISRYSRDSRERTKSYDRPRYRSSRYRDMELVPARTYHDEYRHSSDPRRRDSRPKLHHANTYDDYPAGRGAEPRYLSGPSRRATDLDDRYDYEEIDDQRRRRDGRDGRDMPRSRRQSTMQYDGFDEDFQGGRRDFDDDRRRRMSVGGGRRGGERSYSHYD